jgi:hypothetical protein
MPVWGRAGWRLVNGLVWHLLTAGRVAGGPEMMAVREESSSELQSIGYKWKALTCDNPQMTVGLQKTASVVSSGQ